MENQVQLKTTDTYSIFDKLDEQQIVNADKAVKQKMVYRTKTKDGVRDELSFVGLKHIILEMGIHDQPIEIESSEVKLEKDDPEDKSMWFWRAKVKVRNLKTNYPSEGLSECAYYEFGKYDPFGRTKAHSKAERNAWRKQIPEQRIIELLKAVGKDEIHEVESTTTVRYCQCGETCVVNREKTRCENCGGSLNAYIIKKAEMNKRSL